MDSSRHHDPFAPEDVEDAAVAAPLPELEPETPEGTDEPETADKPDPEPAPAAPAAPAAKPKPKSKPRPARKRARKETT